MTHDRRRAVLPALLLCLAACTGGGDGTPARPSPDEPGPIVIASGRDVTGENGVRRQLIDAWNAQQAKEGSEYRARMVELPGSADEQRSQLLGALQSGSAGYDVVNLDVTWVPEFAESGLVQPLPERLLDDDVIDSVADTARWDGKVYAAPFNSDAGLLYYRRDHLEKAGLAPGDGLGDWQRLEGLFDVLNDKEPPGYDKSWTTQLGPYEGRTVNAVEAFASAVDNLELTDAEGRYTGTEQELEQGLRELRERTRTPYILPDAFEANEAASMTHFVDGRTTFLRHWPYAYGTLHQSFSEEQLGVAPLPGKAVLGGQNLAVAATSERTGKAVELIQYLTGKESERCLLDAGFAATRESAYTDDKVSCTAAAGPAPSPTGEDAESMMPRVNGRPAYAREILLPALRNAVQRPRTPLYGAFTQTFIAHLGELFTDHTSEAELAGKLHAALKKALTG